MPSNYAHYRFGKQLLPTLPADVRRPIQRFRRLYDMGLHGPDLFFYHNLLTQDTVVSLGHHFHAQTGREYFTRVCRQLKEEPNEAALAYLYGMLAHFCLDSVFHPYVLAWIQDGEISHTALETEFDRYLLTLDGCERPHTYNGSNHMKLTRGECVTVAQFFSPATPENVLQSLRGMVWSAKTLAVPKGTKRQILKKAMTLTHADIKGQMIPIRPNRACAAYDEQMKTLYDRAAELFPKLVEQIMAHMTYNAYLGSDFDRTFDGHGDLPEKMWNTMEVRLI